MTTRCSFSLLVAVCGLGLVGCGGGTPTSTVGGGAMQTGGTVGGGSISAGGATVTGGTMASGGAANTGGATKTGGANPTGGTTNTGGVSTVSGGSTAGGAMTGGSPTLGGNTATGGSATGGSPRTGGLASTGGTSTVGSGGTDAGVPAVDTGIVISTGGAGTGGTSSTGGTPTTGGTSTTGGTPATGGTTTTGGTTAQTCGSIASTATRPQLTVAQAANYTVAADGSGTHTSVKAALAAASGSDRVNILVKPGTYREKISVSGSTPITLYGADADASKVVIVYGDSSASAGGTGQSATFQVTNNAFWAKNLTFKNDFDEVATNCSTGCQAVAFLSTGDKNVFENVRFIGNQDTICFNTTGASVKARVYVKGSYIEGDTDYIFGRATVVVDDSELFYTSAWKPTNKGRQIAPSTAASNTYGYLFNQCTFTSQASTTANLIYLGRSWDEGIASAADWNASTSPNGQAVIRESTLGAHIRKVDPWDKAATSARPYDSAQNRFFEYCNTGPGASP